MPFDKTVSDPLSDFWAEKIEEMRSVVTSSSLLPKVEQPAETQKACEWFVGEHGKLYIVSSGKEYRWVTNHPKYPEGVWIPPEMEWESGEYPNV